MGIVYQSAWLGSTVRDEDRPRADQLATLLLLLL